MAAVAAVVTPTLLCACGRTRVAPPTSRLAVARGGALMMTRAGPSDVDASDPRRFRTIILAGPAGVSRRLFLAAEVQAVRRRGWSEVALGPPAVGPPGSVVKLVAPRNNTYVVMSAIGGLDEIANNVGDNPNRAVVAEIDNAFRIGRPLILAVLGPRR